MDKARKVLSKQNPIIISREGQEALASLLQSPPSNPTRAMNQLMSLAKLKKHDGLIFEI